MSADEAYSLATRQIKGLMKKVMHQIRQDALDGKTNTVYYIHQVQGGKEYSPLIDELKKLGYNVKCETIYDQRDGNYCQLTVSWKNKKDGNP